MQNHSWSQTTRTQLYLFAALTLSSCISLLLLALRVVYTGTGLYSFLLWNLILAWIPLALAWMLWFAVDRLRLRVIGGGLMLAWFLFFPNAPYIMTDLIHLQVRDSVPIWYDAALLFSFAWNGLMLGFVSLWMVQSLVACRHGTLAGWLLALSTLAASGFGIYLGRFLRWNSWDVVTEPRRLLADVVVLVTNPLDHPLTLAVTVLFGVMLLAMYLTLTVMMSARWSVTPVRDRA